MGKAKAGARLYRFDLDCGRSGDVEGIFLATEREVEAAYGRTCNFGEILGKHSEVSCVLTAKHIKLLTTDPGFIAKARKYKLVPSGHSPLQAITCDRCGDCLPAPYVECGDEECRKREAAMGGN